MMTTETRKNPVFQRRSVLARSLKNGLIEQTIRCAQRQPRRYALTCQSLARSREAPHILPVPENVTLFAKPGFFQKAVDPRSRVGVFCARFSRVRPQSAKFLELTVFLRSFHFLRALNIAPKYSRQVRRQSCGLVGAFCFFGAQ
jgi:hypothetical protein